MLEEFKIDYDSFFPICVIATMSSGKSTFLNAILGQEILPEKNEACTARALAVLNNDRSGSPKAYVIKQNGSKGYVEISGRSVMEKINADETVKEVLIEMNIPYISNIYKSLVFIDTPGVNNSADKRHAERTKSILDKMNKGVILYLLNATQLGTTDDFALLQMVSEYIKKHKDLKICFVLNKIDMLDEDKENIEEFVQEAREYISNCGIADFMIYPLSALSAKLLRLQLNGQYTTKSEKRYLNQVFKEYRATEKNMLQYSDSYRQTNRCFMIDDEEISEYELRRAIENTGIIGIEKQIIDFVIQSEKDSVKVIFNGNGYNEWEGVYSKKRKAKNIVNYKGKAKWICKGCRQINGDNANCLNCGKMRVVWRKL